MNANKLSLLGCSLLFASTSLLGACADSSIENVVDDAGDFAEPPPEHAATPVGSPTEERLEYGDKSRWSCRTQRVSLQENPERFITLDPNADIIYPGALVQGASLDGGSPEPIPVRRGDGTIVLSLVNGASANFQRHLDEVTHGNVVNAQNELLNGVQNDSIPAKFVYDYQLFDSEEQLAAAMDVKVEWLGGSNVHAAASVNLEKHVTRAVIRLTQEYFTTTFEMPTSPKAFFHPDVTGDELAEYAGPGNPPAYISGVTYGRQFYLVFESTASKQDLQAAVDAVYNGFLVDAEGHLKAEYRETQKETKVKVFAIGGDAESALDVAASASNEKIDGGLFQSLSAYLKKGGTFSTSNPGLPVSYTVRDVKHRNVVKVNLGTEYTERQCNPLVNEDVIRLSLDANKARYDINTGLMVAWPGDTVRENVPTEFNDMQQFVDASNRTWARMDYRSYAMGMDCQAINGISTVITVNKPDAATFNGGPSSILSGGTTSNNTFSEWAFGWNPSESGFGLATYQERVDFFRFDGHYAFQAQRQPSGHVMTTIHNPGNYLYQFANGVYLRNYTGNGVGTMATTWCSVGAGDNFNALPGLVGEVRVYAGEITAAQREMVECELGAKWGIGVEGCKDGRPVKTF